MSDNIANMELRQLRNMVQNLSDELAIMKRKYEDIIYNLDTDNFSSRFVKEQGDMKTAIEVTAKGIETKVSKEDLEQSLSEYSTIEQTAEKIQSTVTKEYVTNLVDGEYVANATLQSEIKQSADAISLSVSETYETKGDANRKNNILQQSIASVSIEADSISSRVASVESGEYNGYTLFEQTSSKFKFVGDVEMSGDAIVGGTIQGSSLQNSGGTHRLEMVESYGGVGDYGTFRLYNDDYGSVPYFSIYDDTLGSITMYGAGAKILKADASGASSGMNVTAYGTWDFSDCDDIDFGSFGTGGGVPYAVFA